MVFSGVFSFGGVPPLYDECVLFSNNSILLKKKKKLYFCFVWPNNCILVIIQLIQKHFSEYKMRLCMLPTFNPFMKSLLLQWSTNSQNVYIYSSIQQIHLNILYAWSWIDCNYFYDFRHSLCWNLPWMTQSSNRWNGINFFIPEFLA